MTSGVTGFFQQNPVAVFILASEIGLWVLLVAGLACRYLLRWRKLSTALLLGIPLLDVVLVVAVAVDLAQGAELGWTHILAGYYLGFSVAFGPAVVRWADARFAYRFAGGPKPPPRPRYGPAKQQVLWREWYRVVIAVAIASVVYLMLIVFFADEQARTTLWWSIGRGWFITGLWLIFGPMTRAQPEPLQTEAPEAAVQAGVSPVAEATGKRPGGSVERG
ncbi:hypothetical protein ODZ83_01965 [Acaricomes phytoseiuli]|uniref:hypothetical protein n=1 Tax=Acaricomes phytoseiuli TaxID=291968 RepID=UPI000373F9CC|nr:hypothetical protein [Acaricomes phytoseiuli]MCW1248970.1 hypothetical protein [Acaricomes phytoseiuli]